MKERRLSAVSRREVEMKMKEKLEKTPKIYLWKTSINKLKLSCERFFLLLSSRLRLRDEKEDSGEECLGNLKSPRCVLCSLSEFRVFMTSDLS